MKNVIAKEFKYDQLDNSDRAIQDENGHHVRPPWMKSLVNAFVNLKSY